MSKDYKTDKKLKKYILNTFTYLKEHGRFHPKPGAISSEIINPQMLGRPSDRHISDAWVLTIRGFQIPAENVAFLIVNSRWPKGKITFRSDKKANITWKNLITEGL